MDSDEMQGLLENTSGSEEDDDSRKEHRINQSSSVFNYEEAIQETGYGFFHYLLLALCGWSISSDAIEVLCVSFLLPSAECELQLTSQDKGWLSAIIFVGMLIGGYGWGSVADIKGRRSVLLWSLTVNGLGGLASSFAQQFWLFMILRFVSGVGVGASTPVIFSYFVEFQPKHKRGPMISLIATFWMGGNIIAAGLAWIIIPHPDFGYRSDSFNYTSWRIFVAVCTIPSFSSAVMYFFMPESPKFLMEKGRDQDALKILEKVYRMNNRHTEVPYRVRSLALSSLGYSDSDLLEPGQRSGRCYQWCQQARSTAKEVLKTTSLLFKSDLISITVVMSVINFTLSFGYYGLWMWFPELFSKLEHSHGSICETVNATLPAQNASITCQTLTDTRVFLDGFLTAVSNLPGNVLSILLMDYVGRKFLLASSMVVSGVSVFFIWLVKNKTQSLVLSCVFGGVSTIGWNALDVVSTEVFPTNVRATAMGLMSVLLRIAAILANVIFGELVDVHCAVPMLMVAVFMAVGGLSAIKLPNTTRTELK